MLVRAMDPDLDAPGHIRQLTLKALTFGPTPLSCSVVHSGQSASRMVLLAGLKRRPAPCRVNPRFRVLRDLWTYAEVDRAEAVARTRTAGRYRWT